jgi:hypothetical protein
MADLKISALTAATTPLAGTEVLPIVQSGTTKQVSVANLTVGRAISATQLTLTTGNVIVASGQGIDFSATPGTGTSELFNDYEEGTWSPAFQSTGGGETITYTQQSGSYTKIGRTVICNFDIDIATVSGGSGNARLINLPFTSSTSASNVGGVLITYKESFVVTGPDLGNVPQNSTRVDLRTNNNTSTNALLWATLQATTRLIGVVIYATS